MDFLYKNAVHISQQQKYYTKLNQFKACHRNDVFMILMVDE